MNPGRIRGLRVGGLHTWCDSSVGWVKKGQGSSNYMCQGLNSHYFHIIGDVHQPTSRGLYTHYKDSY